MMGLNFLKTLKAIFCAEAEGSCDSYYSNLAMQIFRRNLSDCAAEALNKGVLPVDKIKEVYGEEAVAKAETYRSRLDSFVMSKRHLGNTS